MRKIIFTVLATSSVMAMAANNSEFQAFDNQISVGYGMTQTTSGYGTTSTQPSDTWIFSNNNLVNFDVEHLFNNGVWFDVNADMSFGAGPVNINGTSSNNYQSPDYGLNAKVGYAFTFLNQHLQVTPYGLVGLVNTQDITLSNVLNGVTYASNVPANSFSYVGGMGVRVEYRIDNNFLVYFDQSGNYAWDQSGPNFGFQPQDFIQFTSTIGGKVNLYRNLQLGLRGFYSNYQPQASDYAPSSGLFLAQRQSSLGGIFSVGLTY